MAAATAATGGTPAPAPSAIGVVIVSWNVADLLARCLRALFAARLGDGARVVVVDNASTDDTVAVLRRDFPDVTLVINDDNRGFARANNQGLAALGVLGGASGPVVPELVLLLNPDTELAPDALALLADALARHPEAACAGPQLRYPDGAHQSSRRRFPTLASALAESTPVEWRWPDNRVARWLRLADVPPDQAGWVDWVTGAAMLVRAEALSAVGGFDEGYFMYSEELDLCRRLTTAGWRVRYEPRAVVVHHEGKSSDQVVGLRHLYFCRSRVRYLRTHHGWLAATVVRGGILSLYAGELAVEAAKWLAGHKRPLRRARMAAYVRLLSDGLAPDGGRPLRGGRAGEGG